MIPIQDTLSPIGKFFVAETENIGHNNVSLDVVINSVQEEITALRNSTYTKADIDNEFAEVNSEFTKVNSALTQINVELSKKVDAQTGYGLISDAEKAQITSNKTAAESLREDLALTQSDVAGKASSESVSNLQAEMAVQEARMNQLVGEVPAGSADEIADARVMTDGSTANNLGTAIRSQVSRLKEHIDNVSEITRNLYIKENEINCWCNTSDKKLTPDPKTKTAYIECEPNTKYIIRIKTSENVIVMDTDEEPKSNVIGINAILSSPLSGIPFTTGANAHYLCIYYKRSSQSDDQLDLVRKTTMIAKADELADYIPHTSAADYVAREQIEAVSEKIEEDSMRDNLCTGKIYHGYPNGDTFRIYTKDGSTTTYNYTFIPIKKGEKYKIFRPSSEDMSNFTVAACEDVPVQLDITRDIPITNKVNIGVYSSYVYSAESNGYLILYPKDEVYVQKIKVYRFEDTSKPKYPELSRSQKRSIYDLMANYYEKRHLFYYEYTHNRNSYVDAVNMYNASKEQYKLNCVGFVEMIMMGRSVDDFPEDGTQYTGDITKAFDFGYYADFKYRELAYQLADYADDGHTIVSYHGFKDPYMQKDEEGNRTYVGSYSYNTYYKATSTLPQKQLFNAFMNANDLALELYEKGCEIPVSELDVGDIVFFKNYNDNEDTAFFASNICYRHISHVGMVYAKDENGVIEFMECTGQISADRPIVKISTKYSGKLDKLRATFLQHNICMCARLPIAFGYESNVPDKITKLKNAYGN